MSKQITIILVVLLAMAGLYWFKVMDKTSDNATPQETVGTTQNEESSSTQTSTFSFTANGPVGTATGAIGQYLTDKNGMTLYVSVNDEDPSGKISQSCNAQCEKTWLPYLLGEDETAITGSTDPLLSRLNLFKRSDGRQQYALGTQPLYHYVNDLKAGDVTSNLGTTWHVAKP